MEDSKGLLDIFDKCVVAAHAPDALELRGEDATHTEKAVLGAFQYAYRCLLALTFCPGLILVLSLYEVRGVHVHVMFSVAACVL